MTEMPTITIDTNEASQELAFGVFDTKVAEVAELVPELEVIEGLYDEAQKIITEFGIRPSLFDTADRTLVFASIVAKHLSGKAETTGRHELLTSMLTVLAHDHSDTLKHAHDHDGGNADEFDEQARMTAYDAFTDRSLTDELEQAIEAGLLEDVKGRLGIDADNEDQYDVRVLSVAHTDMSYFGLEADKSKVDAEGFDIDAYDALERDRRDISDWKNGLLGRGVDFAKRIGKTELPADAWVTVLDGVTTLCISSPFAEKLMDPTLTDNASYYADNDRARDIAVIEHEYTHTQGGANVDHDIIGVVIEELRAEAFSGSKLGYNDVKSFIGDYAMFTGHDIWEELRSKPKGGSNTELYASIANNVGVDTLADMVFTLPNSYLASDQASGALRDIAKINGGYDGVLTRILKDRMDNGDAGLERRIEEAAKRIASIFNKPGAVLDIDTYVSIRKGQGVSVGIELVRDYIEEHYPKAG